MNNSYFIGLDIPKHGEPAYPAESYGHGWGETGDALGFMVENLRHKSPTINTKTSGRFCIRPSKF